MDSISIRRSVAEMLRLTSELFVKLPTQAEGRLKSEHEQDFYAFFSVRASPETTPPLLVSVYGIVEDSSYSSLMITK